MEKLSLGAAEKLGWGTQQALHTRDRMQDWSGLEAQTAPPWATPGTSAGFDMPAHINT